MIKRLIDRYLIKKPRVREVLTSLLYGGNDVEINILGLKLVINKLKENGYYRASKKIKNSSLLEDEIPVMLSLMTQIKNGGCFVDVGANIGIYSSIFAKASKITTDFQTLAFEVNPQTFSRLKQNALLNGFDAYNIGISNCKKRIEFIQGSVSHVTTTRDKKNHYSISERTFWASCKPLDDILIEHKDIILKIDVEGQETEVLQGAQRLLKENRIRAIYIDGYEDPQVWGELSKHFSIYDGRTLAAADHRTFSLLAIRKKEP